MIKLSKPTYSVKQIVLDCASSYRDEQKKCRFNDTSDFIQSKSDEYDSLAEINNLSSIDVHSVVNNSISKDEMIELYEKKFVKQKDVRSKYYDKIMVAANGTCPICGLGQVQNLDHYLPKTLYPTYAVTPVNLVPSCRDCNFIKNNAKFNKDTDAPIHPYYNDVNSIVWLKVRLLSQDGDLIPVFYVDEDLKIYDNQTYERYNNHMNTYNLFKRYSIEATRDIAENIFVWKKCLSTWGTKGFVEYLNEIVFSMEQTQKNKWKAALYRALAEKPDIINQ